MKVIVTPGFVIYFAWESIYFAYLDFKCSKKVPKFLKLCLSKKTQCCSQYTYIYISYTYVVPTIQTVTVAFYV